MWDSKNLLYKNPTQSNAFNALDLIKKVLENNDLIFAYIFISAKVFKFCGCFYNYKDGHAKQQFKIVFNVKSSNNKIKC